MFFPDTDADLQRYYHTCWVRLHLRDDRRFWVYVDRIHWCERDLVALYGYNSDLKRHVYSIPSPQSPEKGDGVIDKLWPDRGYYQWGGLAFWVTRIPERHIQRAASLRTLAWECPLLPYLPNMDGLNPPMEWTDALGVIDAPVSTCTLRDAIKQFDLNPRLRSLVVRNRDWALSLAPVPKHRWLLWYHATPVAYIAETLHATVVSPVYRQELIDTFGGEVYAAA